MQTSSRLPKKGGTMYLSYLTDSTSRPASSFGGPYRSAFPTLYARFRSPDTAPPTSLLFGMADGGVLMLETTAYPNRVSYSFGGSLDSTSGKLVERVLGIILLAMMPASGLSEAVQSLRDILEFH